MHLWGALHLSPGVNSIGATHFGKCIAPDLAPLDNEARMQYNVSKRYIWKESMEPIVEREAWDVGDVGSGRLRRSCRAQELFYI